MSISKLIYKKEFFVFYSAKKAQEERPLHAVADSFKKIIVTGSDIKPRRDESGIETVGILDFLCDENSLDS